MTIEMMSEAIDETLDKDEAEEETEDLTNHDEIGVGIASQFLPEMLTVDEGVSSFTFSPESSSRDLPLDSGTKNVISIPTKLMTPSMINEFFTPIPGGYPASVFVLSFD